MMMSRATKVMAGLILLAIPTIQYGGYFLLTQLMDRESGYMANALRQNFFRAGHAHAGVITLLSLIAQVLVDAANLPSAWRWLVRVGIPLAGILISAGFFFSVAAPTTTTPNHAVYLIYLGRRLWRCASSFWGSAYCGRRDDRFARGIKPISS